MINSIIAISAPSFFLAPSFKILKQPPFLSLKRGAKSLNNLITGFAAKFLVFRSALGSGHVLLAVLGVASSVISAFFYLRLAVLMYMKAPHEPAPDHPPTPVMIALAIAAAVILLAGVFPESLSLWVQISTSTMTFLGP